VATAGIIGGIIAASLGGADIARAQVRGTLDVGGASVRYGDSVRVTATTIAPAIRLDGGPFTAEAAGSVSAGGGGVWSSQGGLAASLLSRRFGVGQVEVVTAGGGTMHQDGTRTGQYLGRARLHASGVTRGLWIGAAAGQGWDGSLWRGSVEGDVGVWAQRNGMTVVGTVRPVSIADSIRFTDLAAMVRHEATRLDLSASAGVRSGIVSQAGSPNAWGSVSAALWVAPTLALVADGGSYAADPNQGFPGGTYLSVSLRIAPNRRRWARGAERVPSTAAVPRGAVAASNARVEVVAQGSGRYVVRVRAPGARKVEIMGDFTGWKPTDLTAAPNGWWSVVIQITPGVAQMNVRLDGGAWTVPAGATAQTDEFGAPVGVVIVR
jgi:hypothetical protein